MPDTEIPTAIISLVQEVIQWGMRFKLRYLDII